MSSIGWRLVRAGSGKGAVLCLNFTAGGTRAQAGFADLAPHLPEGYAVWGTEESAWPSGSGMPGAQLDAWLDRGVAVDAPVRAVFGFCGTAALASVLASRLAGSGAPAGTPAVVLFDPIVVGAQNMIDQAEDSLRQLAAIAPGKETPDKEPPNKEPPDKEPPNKEPPDLDQIPPGVVRPGVDVGEAELGELATGLARHYAARAAAVGASRSVRAATVAELCTRFETYLRYLSLCTTAWSHPRVAPDLLVLSRDHEPPTELSGTALVRLDATQHKLLAHPEAARAAGQVLAGLLVERRS